MKARASTTIKVADATGAPLHFSQQHLVRIFVDDGAHLFQISHGFWSAIGEYPRKFLGRRGLIAEIRIGWIIAEQVVFSQHGAGIDAEAVDTTLKPESQHVAKGAAYGRIVPVEIGLLRQEGVII